MLIFPSLSIHYNYLYHSHIHGFCHSEKVRKQALLLNEIDLRGTIREEEVHWPEILV